MKDYLPLILAVAIGGGWLMTRNRQMEPVPDVQGVWMQKGGDRGVLRVQQMGKNLRADFAPWGNRTELYPLQGVVEGNSAHLYGRVRGRAWHFRLTADHHLVIWMDADALMEEFQPKYLGQSPQQKAWEPYRLAQVRKNL